MKKLVIAAAVAGAVLSSNAMAGDLFAGVEAGKVINKLESFDLKGAKISDNKFKTNDFGVRFGQYLNDNVRVYGTLDFNKKDFVKQTRGLVSGDYIFTIDAPVKPFVGGSLGAARLDIDVPGIKAKTGFAYGVQGGLLYQAGSVDVELGLKYVGNTAKIKTDNKPDIKFDNSRQAYIAASFRF